MSRWLGPEVDDGALRHRPLGVGDLEDATFVGRHRGMWPANPTDHGEERRGLGEQTQSDPTSYRRSCPVRIMTWRQLFNTGLFNTGPIPPGEGW